MLSRVQTADEHKVARPSDPEGLPELYLDLLKRALTRIDAVGERLIDVVPVRLGSRAVFGLLRPILRRRGIRMIRTRPNDRRAIEIGFGAHPDAETMIGLRRLDNIQQLALEVLRAGVPGDLVETGVWRGGATIFMRGILAAYGDAERAVWAADSFEGLPTPDVKQYPADDHAWLWQDGQWFDNLRVSLEDVRANFERYGLLDERVRFLPGWFKDTLPEAKIDRIALLRLDGDLYESTIQALDALYPKVSPGGYVIVDDYGSWESCRKATDDYRTAHGISDEIVWIDWTGAYWRKGEVPDR
jgi:O-methyltransferase